MSDRTQRKLTVLGGGIGVALGRYALVLADADDTGEHKVHENELNLEELKKMIPKLAQHAAIFEGVHEEGHKYHGACAQIPEFRDPAYLGVYVKASNGISTQKLWEK